MHSFKKLIIMKKYNVGIIGNGFVGESQAFVFSPTSNVFIYDIDPLKSIPKYASSAKLFELNSLKKRSCSSIDILFFTRLQCVL